MVYYYCWLSASYIFEWVMFFPTGFFVWVFDCTCCFDPRGFSSLSSYLAGQNCRVFPRIILTCGDYIWDTEDIISFLYSCQAIVLWDCWAYETILQLARKHSILPIYCSFPSAMCCHIMLIDHFWVVDVFTDCFIGLPWLRRSCLYFFLNYVPNQWFCPFK